MIDVTIIRLVIGVIGNVDERLVIGDVSSDRCDDVDVIVMW